MNERRAASDAALTRLRDELDEIDGRLLAALADRLACCRRVAELKRTHGIAMMQPGRVAQVLDRAAAYADGHGMDPTFVRDLYERLIAEACRVEDEIIDGQVAESAS